MCGKDVTTTDLFLFFCHVSGGASLCPLRVPFELVLAPRAPFDSQEIAQEDKRLKRNVLDQRRFIVVDGLYRNYGDLCPLPRLLELKAK